MKYSFNEKEDKIGILLFLIGIIFLLVTSYIGLSKIGLWADEIYSLAIIKMPLNEFFNYSLRDVHPILYYVFLKIITKIFYFIDLTYVGKLFSLIPILLIGVLSITKIRKNFGMLTAGLFFLCICSMPRILTSALEVRMYSWGLFFITASWIYVYEIINDSTWKKWVILTILTILSAYTHYFSAVSSFVIYLIILIYIIRKNSELFKNWLLSTIICIISYIPWLTIIYNQVLNVNNGYWIENITFKTIISYIYYIFSPAFDTIRNNDLVEPTILGTLLLFSFIYLFYKYKDEFTINTMLVVILVPLIGIIISLIKQPIFHARYLIPVLGCVWLIFSILLTKSFKNSKLFTPVTVLVIIIGIIGVFAYIPIHDTDVTVTDMNHDYISKTGENNVVIINYDDVYFPYFCYFAPNNHHIIYSPRESNLSDLLNSQNIINLKNNGSKIYYIDNNIEIIKNLRNNNINLTEIPSNEPAIDTMIYEIKT